VTRLVFGEVTREEAAARRMEEPIGWNDPIPQERRVDAHPTMNPCVRVFGEGPLGVTCKSCTYLRRLLADRAYYKCYLRPDSKGAGTDHRLNWPACDRYIKRPEGKKLKTIFVPK
jgi:hypothetical protein